MTIVSCTDFIVLAITCQAVRQVLCNIIQATVEQLLFATDFQEVYQSPMHKCKYANYISCCELVLGLWL